MHISEKRRSSDASISYLASEKIAAAYNRAGEDYITYADGDAQRLFSFEGLHAYADGRVWAILQKKLSDLRATGASSLNVLDAGCGPGTWLRRIVTHARQLGFPSITARGFDIAQTQILTARARAHDLAGLPGITLTFDVADLARTLPEADSSVDVALCLYSVLSHLPIVSLPKVAAEMARVTKGWFITTVRAVGSTPTIFVDSIEKARDFKFDHKLDRCEIEMRNGSRLTLSFHLFSAQELNDSLGQYFEVEDLYGLDVFHSRFAPDHRWNTDSLLVNPELVDELAKLEEAYGRSPCFVDKAMHILFIGRQRARLTLENNK